MSILPESIINKIILYNSHPLADLFKQSESYKYYNEESVFYFREDRHQTFSEFYFEQYMLNGCCDCCAKPWRDCQCICSNCSNDYSLCKSSCHDNPQPDKWCCSCDRYYTGYAYRCPGCD